MNSTNTNPTHNLEGHTVTRFTGNVTNVTDLFLGLCPSTFRLHLGILAAQTNRRGCLELMLAAQPPHRGGYVAAPLPGVKSAKESNRSHWVNFLGGPIILWDTLNTVTGSIGFNMSTSTCLRMDLLILGFEPLLHGYPRATSWKDWLSCCNSEPPGSPLLYLLHSPAIFAGRKSATKRTRSSKSLTTLCKIDNTLRWFIRRVEATFRLEDLLRAPEFPLLSEFQIPHFIDQLPSVCLCRICMMSLKGSAGFMVLLSQVLALHVELRDFCI